MPPLASLAAQMDKDAFFIGDHDIRTPVPVEIDGRHLRSHAAIIVDQMRFERDRALRATAKFEPAYNGGRVGFFVACGSMGPKSLAGHDIFEAVPIHIHQVERVHLAYPEIGCRHIGSR